ncbi:DUF1553 domain-containing protein [Catalinimonas niigatensis]|uniref:DUF1553 domain-containing protein n=1 Tax=Catalinimonas niigatensis TaxID=1397264 RepID=UPI00266545CE|nr:DUF1553 domain-containing protein [Catalinimonas niigatensis]WPP48343.1 DUF1553 domain-containing protein [Catalinimonas niigatensis]
MKYLSLLYLLFLLAACQPQQVQFAPELEARLPRQIDFNFHVKPILSDRCFACHGPDENAREADLRLDLEEMAFAALGEDKDHYALVKGDVEESQVYHRIISQDPEIMMPPPESNLELSEYEVALLTRWIEQGAEYKQHWSFIKAEKPEVPEVEEDRQAKNEIDPFILKRMEREALTLSPEASKETLLRRVTFDLTGLPPTIEEMDAFLQDDAPDAYEKVVDRLLASPHYGERMAAQWMEISRYADTHGYQDDQFRYMWPWRDWVIQAFNQNLPYDQFVTWQIAGDLLPNATKEQIVATGFNRNHVQNVEGGIIEEEYRVEYVADRTNTLGKAFLGLTTECARCHDHKYDPISQEDYYSMFAFFNNTDEVGRPPRDGGEAPGPALLLTDEETEKQLSFLKEKIAEQEAKLAEIRKEEQQPFTHWLATDKGRKLLQQTVPAGLEVHFPMGKASHEKLKELEEVEGKSGKATLFNGTDGAGLDLKSFERSDPFTLSFWIKSPAVKDYAGVLAYSSGYYGGYRGYEVLLVEDHLEFRLSHEFPYNALQVVTREPLKFDQWQHITITYDGSSQAAGIAFYFNGEKLPLDIQRDHLYRTSLPINSQFGNSRYLRLGTRDNEKGFAGGALDELMIFHRALSLPEILKLSGNQEKLEQLLTKQSEQLSEDEKTALQDYYLSTFSADYQAALKKLQSLRRAENDTLTSIPKMMVMGDRADKRPTYLLERGAYDAHGKEVNPGTPEQVFAFPETLSPDRLGLAQWLTHPDNPLTARVAVNRLWQQFFGEGIVGTADDFGSQGALPTHPALLDWLTVSFVESGWDVKALQKRIVMSATYRQSSQASEELLKRDPENLLLARGPNRRLPAEMIRNNALAASGLLARKIGGPSVKPYQPPGLWREKASVVGEREYKPGKGEDLYRRSLYTYWRRTIPPPSMLTFDADARNVCTVERQVTSTPLQALILLNDPQYVEASRILAERMQKETDQGLDEQLNYGFRLLTGRSALEGELEIFAALYQDELEKYTAEPESARELLKVGEHHRDEQLDLSKTAALAIVTNIMMNHDEFYTLR